MALCHCTTSRTQGILFGTLCYICPDEVQVAQTMEAPPLARTEQHCFASNVVDQSPEPECDMDGTRSITILCTLCAKRSRTSVCALGTDILASTVAVPRQLESVGPLATAMGEE